MLITIGEQESIVLGEAFKKASISFATIGKITENEMLLVKSQEQVMIQPPESDELYKVVD